MNWSRLFIINGNWIKNMSAVFGQIYTYIKCRTIAFIHFGQKILRATVKFIFIVTCVCFYVYACVYIHMYMCLSVYMYVAAKLLQSCPTLRDPIDGSPPGSPVPGILQARTLEWVAISFSNAGSWKVKVKSLSRVRLLATPWTAAYQAPPSMGFSREEYWSGVPCVCKCSWNIRY